MALRDLRMHAAGLSGDDVARAAVVLSRPPQQGGWTSEETRDFDSGVGARVVKVHWDADAPTPPTSAYIDQVGAVVTHVLQTYAAAGYRSPESDDTAGGGSGALDIYLDDFGGQGLYGYCDSDSAPPAKGPYDRAAYCAFDNDFAEFPNRTPLENLEVTAAHELFHAVQFAYDYTEDRWFMEATAVWAEDEVYTEVNDNRQYFASSPLRQPRQALDQFSNYGLRQYGDWIFIRYLSERFPRSEGGLPVIVRRIWERADGSSGSRDNYSIQAIGRELISRGTDLRRVFAQFADANRRPARTYREGSAYPKSPARLWSLTRGSHDTQWRSVKLNHLATSTMQFTRRAGFHRLAIRVNLPNTARGSAAVVTVYGTHGKHKTGMVRLGGNGDGSKTVQFGHRVARVEVTLANAGTHYKCWHGAVDGVLYSCQGASQDDHLTMQFRVRARR